MQPCKRSGMVNFQTLYVLAQWTLSRDGHQSRIYEFLVGGRCRILWTFNRMFAKHEGRAPSGSKKFFENQKPEGAAPPPPASPISATATSCCQSSDAAAKKRETAAKLSFKVGLISLTDAPLVLKIQSH